MMYNEKTEIVHAFTVLLSLENLLQDSLDNCLIEHESPNVVI